MYCCYLSEDDSSLLRITYRGVVVLRIVLVRHCSDKLPLVSNYKYYNICSLFLRVERIYEKHDRKHEKSINNKIKNSFSLFDVFKRKLKEFLLLYHILSSVGADVVSSGSDVDVSGVPVVSGASVVTLSSIVDSGVVVSESGTVVVSSGSDVDVSGEPVVSGVSVVMLSSVVDSGVVVSESGTVVVSSGFLSSDVEGGLIVG